YLVVCVFWGSTYLSIKVGVTDLPPFLFAGLRFAVAGVLLLIIARALGDPLPKRSDWRTLAIVGLLLLAGGNAFVVWSEQYIGSGIASIFVVTVAMWTALFDAIIPGGSSDLNWRVVAGLLLGFLGTLLLVGATPAEILAADKRGPIALTMASASWSLGTVYAKRHPTEASPYMGAAIQMIVGGAAVALIGTVLGEWAAWQLSPRGIGAIAYLVIFGSILGYSAYSYALRHASATIVGTYAYVNPVIAVLLGWLLLHEPVGPRTFIAMGMILVAVVWIQFSLKQRRSDGLTARRVSRSKTKSAPCPVNRWCRNRSAARSSARVSKRICGAVASRRSWWSACRRTCASRRPHGWRATSALTPTSCPTRPRHSTTSGRMGNATDPSWCTTLPSRI